MNRQISQQFRNRRTLLGVTQEDLSEISGVSVRTIKAVENGSGNPTVAVLSRLLEAVGLKLSVVERVAND